MTTLLKKPSAWIPILLTIGMLAVLAMYLAQIFPPDPVGDEGAGAHLFQLWIPLEALLIGYFALVHVPQRPKEALAILAVQIGLALVPLVIVFSLGL